MTLIEFTDNQGVKLLINPSNILHVYPNENNSNHVNVFFITNEYVTIATTIDEFRKSVNLE